VFLPADETTADAVHRLRGSRGTSLRAV
jgi:hypothetical protein